ncbi:Myb-like DNA-binding domain protein [Ceratobasidium sp. AG-Ba]|nr:Myb-like DNA-binding domain protein [Ceratobasidium sp. AG-Ba]
MPEYPPLPIFNAPPPGYPHSSDMSRRRYIEPIDTAPKSARHPGVYQRPPPGDFRRNDSPPHQPHRWPPAGPPDEPVHPPRPDYRREPWDYRYREPGAGPPPPEFASGRPPSPFHEWSRPPPPQGWSPRRGSDSDWGPRRDWDEREPGPAYGSSRAWDRPPSPPPRDWQIDPYSRRPLPPLPPDQPRGTPPLIHEPAWGREPLSHFDQFDRREEWVRPDGWTEGDDMDPHIYPSSAHPVPYGSSGRPRGRSFMQDRRPPPPSGSGYSPVQPSPRGPGPVPLDPPSRRHSTHDRRYSGPGYSGDNRAFVPNNAPRRQFQSGRSFNDPNRAKLVPRDQLLVANTSIKVEDPDGHTLITPGPASAGSTSPEKSTGKRSRTDSVAADAEPASRRPSPFTNSVPATAESVVTTEPILGTPSTSSTAKEQPSSSGAESGTNVKHQSDSKPAVEVERAELEPGEHAYTDTDEPTDGDMRDIPEPDNRKDSAEEKPQSDLLEPVVVVKESTEGETAMDSEPSATLPEPSLDVPVADSTMNDVSDEHAPEAPANESLDEEDTNGSPLPLLHFDYLGFSDDEDEQLPATSVREAIPLRSLDLNRMATSVETALENNLKLASHRQPIRTFSEDIPTLEIFSLPDENTRAEFRNLLRGEFSEREEYVENKLGNLEEEYLTLNEAWFDYCQKLDEAAEKRRVREAAAIAAAAQNVVSEPVAAQTRSTRRNPVVNAGVMADAVHSDFEMEKVMNNMRDAAAVDPDLLARPNLARIPDMVTVTEPEMLRFTFDDENGQVDDPTEFYDFKGRAVEHWTTEERDIFIEQHRIFNKRFDKIAEHLPHKTTSQCVQYYYLMKKVPAFRAQVKRGQRRRLGRGGHQGKASALMADIENTEDGATASPREDEFIATRRSRRQAAIANANAPAQSSTPPPSTTADAPKSRRTRVVELARADSFDMDRAGTATPASLASDSDAGGDVPHPSDLDLMLSTQPLRKGGPGRGRRWAYKGETPNGSGGSVRLDGTEPSKKRPATTSYWTVAERTALKQNLLRHGRDWNRIAAVIQTKTAIQAKNYYFNNQKEMSVFGEADSSANLGEGTPSASASPAPTTKKEEPKKSTGPVTIQPAPGQSPTAINAAQKASSGRGNSHYPNVIPQPPLPQQQTTWAKSNAQQKPKPHIGVPAPIVPTPPLPLPGPTFRAWPVSSAPSHPPHMAYSYGSFSGGPGMMKPGPGPVPVANPAPRPSGPPPGVAGPSGTGGVQRGVNHYPGPMRYQPYPVAASNMGGTKGKAVPPRNGTPGKPNGPIQPPTPASLNRVIIPPRGVVVGNRSGAGQPASWNGEDKGKRSA